MTASRRAIFWNVIPAAAQIFSAGASVPLFIGGIGQEAYGAYILIWMIILGTASIDLGISKSTIRLLAKFKGSAINTKKIISTSFWSSFFYLLFVLIVFIVAAPQLATNIEEPGLRRSVVNSLWIIWPGIVIAQLGNITSAIYESFGKFKTLSLFVAAQNSVFSIAPAALSYALELDLESVIEISIFLKSSILLLLVVSPSFTKCNKLAKPSLRHIQFILKYGLPTFKNTTATYTIDTADKYVLPLILNTSALASYAIAFNLVAKVRVFPESVGRVLYPRLSAASQSDAFEILRRSTWWLSYLCTMPVLFLIMFSDNIFKIWIPSIYSAEVLVVAQVLIVGLWVNAVAYPAYAFSETKGNPAILLKIYRYSIPIYFFALFVLSTNYGIIGCAVAWALRAGLDALFLMHLTGIPYETIGKILIKILLISSSVILPWVINVEAKVIIFLIFGIFFATYLYRSGKYKQI